MMLVSGKQKSTGLKVLYGGFYAKPILACPSSVEPDQDFPITSAPEDFFFVHRENEGFYWFTPNNINGNACTIELFSDYESGGAISMGSDFILVSFSYDFAFAVGGGINALKKKELISVPTASGKPTELNSQDFDL